MSLSASSSPAPGATPSDTTATDSMPCLQESESVLTGEAKRPQRPAQLARRDYRRFSCIDTRWMDNDVYGHVNNVVYYSWFDTAVNRYLIEAGALDIERGSVIGLVVETHCRYFTPLAFPQTIEAGLRVARIGHSSVCYEVGLFAQGVVTSAAQGHFVHVYVDRGTRRPVELPAPLKNALQGLM
jgi:acyl-CoA thioester hydrolase